MLQEVIRIAEEAGRKILSFYDGDQGVTYKDDSSPLTLADRAAHHHIVDALSRQFPDIPVISEEGRLPDAAERAAISRFFLVDPLDGTKEFIKRNGEFTVNIALIEDGRPVLGVVHIPVQNRSFAASAGLGARLSESGGEPRRIHAAEEPDIQALRVSMSRSHPSGQLDAFLKQLDGMRPAPLGSSLKFCSIAEGKVDFYPRFGPLCEWDTAAADIVLVEAGGVVTDLKGEPLRYNKDVMKHYGLLAVATPNLLPFLLERMPEVEIIDDRA
ncbi:MAG: 3'(2'),5'-bisphosphate nucleotidase CysQ [Acidobacteriota bacterium]|nr:3'(2'),5'-bisphosphate nucleotidase CysQ [Acidobacteriota bacterium]